MKIDESDITEAVGSAYSNYQLKEENKLTNHSWKTFVGLGIVFVIGGLQALHGGGFESWAETLIPVLLALEHTLNGNV